MEESPEILLSFVPSNLRGADVLLVHDEKFVLTYLKSLLEQYTCRVTESEVAAEAESIIRNEEGKYKLVIAKANMPCMDIVSFVNFLLQRHIPLVCIYYEEYAVVAAKEAFKAGAAFILEEPIIREDLNCMWQHIYQTRENPEKANPITSCIDKADETNARKRIHDDNRGNPIGNIAKLTSDQGNIDNNGSASGENTTKRKKRNVVWTPELRQKFTEAMNELGGRKNPKAKEILEKMNVHSLTVRQVASHMQRQKYQMQREHESRVPAVTISSNFRGRTEFPTPPGSSRLGITGVTAPAATSNENRDQNQSTTDVANPLHHQQTQHNASRYGVSTRLSNYGSRNVDAIAGNRLPTVSRSQSQSLLRPLDITRFSSTTHGASGLSNYGRRNLDAVVGNHVPNALRNQNQPLFQPQYNSGNSTFQNELSTGLGNYGRQNQDNASVACEHQRGLMNYGRQNLDALTGNHVLDISTNQNQSLLQLQDNTSNAAFQNEIQPGLCQYGNQNIGTVVQNHVPTALMDQNQYLNQPEENQANATFSHDGFADFESLSSDVAAPNRVQADLESQNQFLQLQQNISVAPFGVLAGLPNYRGQNIGALVGNPVPAASLSQSPSHIQQQVTSGNAAIMYEPPAGVGNYGCQNVDSAAASVNQNQSLLQYQQNCGSATFPYGFPTQLDNYGNQILDAVEQNLVPDASMNCNNQSLQLQGTQDKANFYYEFPAELANYGSENMDVVQNGVPAVSVNQNQCPFQRQTTQGYGTCSSDLPTGLANYGCPNLDILAQDSVPPASLIPNESQGIAKIPSEVPTGLANHGSQNTEAALPNHVPKGLANDGSQDGDAHVNNPMTNASTVEIQSQDAVHLEWVRRFLFEDN